MVVVVPERRFLAIEGIGQPLAADFRLATSVVRKAEESLRARLRRERLHDPRKAVIEIVWWAHPEVPPDEFATAYAEHATLHWRQMIEIPPAATDAAAEEAIDQVRVQAGRTSPLLRVVGLAEGRAAQILHVAGPESESDTIRKLYDFVIGSGLRPSGDLHQLVLADPDLVPRARSRSIFRLPVASA